MESPNPPQEPRTKLGNDSPSTSMNGFSSHFGRLRAFFADRRVSLSGLLLFSYAAGIVSAFYIRDAHPVAVVHPGPYALVAIYQGNVYELVPMEDSVRHRQGEFDKPKTDMEKIGQVESHKSSPETPSSETQNTPHKQTP